MKIKIVLFLFLLSSISIFSQNLDEIMEWVQIKIESNYDLNYTPIYKYTPETKTINYGYKVNKTNKIMKTELVNIDENSLEIIDATLVFHSNNNYSLFLQIDGNYSTSMSNGQVTKNYQESYIKSFSMMFSHQSIAEKVKKALYEAIVLAKSEELYP